MDTIGQRLKEERERLGMSQTAFAEAGGVQKRAQVNYEGDERKPDAGYLAGVAELGADVLYVLTGERSSAYGRAGGSNVHTVEEPSRRYSSGPALDPAWPQVLELVVDALKEHGKRMPSGAKLRELVDAVLVVLRMEEGELNREKTRRKINALL